jgi:PAS domain S-box-containing protein
MTIPLRVLIVDDSESDAQLLVQAFGKAGYEVASRRVETGEAMAAALAQDRWDCVVADHSLPAFDAFGALETLQASGQDIPLIVVSEGIGEEAAVALMKAGATDYVMKDRLSRLGVAVPRELREAATRRQYRQTLATLRESEEKYRRLFDFESYALFLIERESGRILEANAGATALYGYSHDEWLTMRNVDVSVEVERTTAATLTGVKEIPLRWHRKKDGTVFPVDIQASHFDWQGRAVHLAAIRDITERVRTQEALRAERDRAESYLQVAGVIMVALDTRGKITLINRRGCEVLGYTETELLGKDWFEVCLPRAESGAVRAAFDRILAGSEHGLDEYENPIVTKSGELRLISWRNSRLRDTGGSLLGVLSSGEDITERRRAEDALREHERLMADAQAIAHFGSWSIDFNSGQVTWSKEMFRLYGLSPEPNQPPTRLQFAELIHPDDRAAEAAWSSQWRSGKPLPTLELRTRPIHGAVRWLSNHGLLERDSRGEPLRFIGTVLDITDRKQAQESLRESEERHLTILQTAMDGFWQVDTEGRLLEVNETYCRMSGYTEQELLSMRIQDLEAVESPGDTTAHIDKILAQGEARFESRHRRKDGTIFDVEISAQNRPAEGGRLVIFVRDITARKRSAEALHESQEKYRLLVETATECIIVVQDGLLKFVNPITLTMLGGYSEHELIDRPFAEFIHPDDRGTVVDNHRRRIAREEHQARYAFRVLARGGIVKWVEINATLIEWQGKPATLNLLTDVTARKEAEETLREREEFLSNLLELAPVSIYVTAADGRMRLVNRRWEADTAKPRSEILGRPLDQVFSPETARQLTAENQKVLDDGVSVAFEQVIEAPVEPHYFYTVKFPLRDALGRIDAVGGISVDITARKLAEQTLRESEQTLREAQEIARIGRWEMNLATGRLGWSEGVFALFEISRETSAASYEAGLELIHPDDRARVAEAYRDSIDYRKPYEIEHRLLMPGGRVKWVSVIGRTEYGETGQPIRSVGTVQDITARKQSEEILRIEQERLDLAVSATGLGLYDWNPKTGAVLFSERWAAMFGYRLDELPDHPLAWSERVHPDDLPLVREATQAAFRDGTPLNCEYRMRHRDGSWRWILDQGRIVTRDAQGEVIRFVGADLDITERKRAEEQLGRSEADLRQAQQVAHVGSWRWNIKTGHLDWSDEMYRIFGIAKEVFSESLPDVIARAIHPDDRAKVEASNALVVEQGKPFPLEYRIVWPDGTVRVVWAEAGELTRDEAGEPAELTGIVLDVTERTRAEQAVRDSNTLLERTLAGLDDAVLVVNSDTRRFLMCNPAVERVFGYRPTELVGESTRLLHVSEDSYEAYTPRRLAATGPDGISHLEYQRRRKDGSVFWSENTVTTLASEPGGSPLVVNLVRDITQRKWAEEALRESEARLRDITFSMADWVWEVDANGVYTYSSQKGADLFGPPDQNIIGKTPFDLMPEDEAKRVAVIFSEIAAIKAPIKDLENWNITKNGERICLLTNGVPILDEAGNLKGYRGVDKDITERKRADEALRESEEHYRSLFERMLNGYAYCRMLFVDGRPDDFIYLNVNSAFETLTGLKDVVGKKVSTVIPGIRETDRELLEAYGRVSLTGTPERLETYVSALAMWFSISVYSPKKEHFVAVFDVITERKRAEEALRQTERDLVDAQKLAGVGSWTYDPATQQPKWSEGMFRVWGLDPTLGAPSYADHRKYVHPEDYPRFDAAVQEAVQHGIPYQFDLRICRPDGTMRTITSICEPQRDADGSVVSLKGTVQDITERKQSDDAIRASLHEKELLLREIHHRVKNNLQIIASLLTLQAETVRDPAALEVFMDSQNRIRAMALIHAKLYQSADLATVDFGAFVRDLGTILLRAYAVNPSAIRLQVGAGRTELAIDTVIPCSLIVNELLTNAIKYAFPSGSAGVIAVDLSQQEAEYTLRVADNGAGFPSSVDFRNTESLGLRLVVLLVDQLDGTFELNNEGGAEFTIRFPRRSDV